MLDAVARNHRSWFGRGRELVELEGLALYLGAASAVLAFPRADGDLAGALRLALDAGVREVGCWALAPDERLGRRLHDLGFQDGWQPHWMGADPRRATARPAHEVEETTDCSSELPYAGTEHRAALGGDVHHLVARDAGEIAGHVVLNVEGDSGGIYDMGVAPPFRRRGHGLALTLAALERARAAGCASVTLNATGEGEPVYRRAGFESLGLGMTWWLIRRGRGLRRAA